LFETSEKAGAVSGHVDVLLLEQHWQLWDGRIERGILLIPVHPD
jgi:hypothetical protein